VFDGVVVEVKIGSVVSGVHVSNLFSWNSVMIRRIVITDERYERDEREGGKEESDERGVDGVDMSVVVEDRNEVRRETHTEEDLFVEYVHISNEGIQISEGDIVRMGQVICQSGDAGFCPEPHLHMQMQRSRDPGSTSVPLTWRGEPIRAGVSYP
jgi:hypothetical protein